MDAEKRYMTRARQVKRLFHCLVHAENVFSPLVLNGSQISVLVVRYTMPVLSYGASNVELNYIICTGERLIIDFFCSRQRYAPRQQGEITKYHGLPTYKRNLFSMLSIKTASHC
jgi:hypothetical protein